MRLTCAITLFIFTQILAIPCNNKKPSLKLVCYYSEVSEIDICKCTHIILPSNTNISTIENVKEKFREGKTLITVNEFNQVRKCCLQIFRILLLSNYLIYNLKKL